MKMVRNITQLTVGILAGICVNTSGAFALPLATAEDDLTAKFAPSTEWLSSSEVDFTAIIALSNCSGSLVRFTTSQPSDQAMVLTNGHCHEDGLLDAGTVVVNKDSRRRLTLLASNGHSTLATLRALRIMYGTMTDTDMMLYQTTATYEEIASKYGVEAMTISADHPQEGTPIHIVSGYWKKIYSCTIEDFVYELKEDQWTFKDSLRFTSTGCETIGGTSGSPILSTDTKEVIAINNTGNEDGKKCTMNNPCEVDENGDIKVQKKGSYGQQTYLVYTCLAEDNSIDLDREGCALPKGK